MTLDVHAPSTPRRCQQRHAWIYDISMEMYVVVMHGTAAAVMVYLYLGCICLMWFWGFRSPSSTYISSVVITTYIKTCLARSFSQSHLCKDDHNYCTPIVRQACIPPPARSFWVVLELQVFSLSLFFFFTNACVTFSTVLQVHKSRTAGVAYGREWKALHQYLTQVGSMSSKYIRHKTADKSLI